MAFFGNFGWIELLILLCPGLAAIVIVFIVLFATGVLGGKKKQ